MAYVAISSAHSLAQNRRLDAEYFSPAGIEATRIVENLPRLTRLYRITERVTQGPNPRFSSTGIPCLNGKNIYFGTASAGEPNFVSRQEYERLRDYQLLENDLVITLKHATKIGRTWIIESTDNKIFTRNVGMIRLKSHSIVNHASLLFYLCSDYAQRILDRIATGGTSGQITLATSALKNLPIPIFYDSFQLVLDSYLMNYHIVLGKSQTKFRDAEGLLLAELGLADWQPGHTLTFIRRYSEATHARRLDAEHFQPKFLELRERIRNYPAGFCPLKQTAINSQETIEPAATPEREFQYIELANINQAIGVIEDANQIRGKEAPSRARMVLRSGDVIASSVQGSLDKVALVSDEYNKAVGSTGFFVLRPRTVESGYLLALTKSLVVREQMLCEATGTILSAVSANALQNIIVPDVSPEKREEIDHLVHQSHVARREAKALLEKAKKAVEIAIEEGEDVAMRYLE